jgi:hypothetical protein
VTKEVAIGVNTSDTAAVAATKELALGVNTVIPDKDNLLKESALGVNTRQREFITTTNLEAKRVRYEGYLGSSDQHATLPADSVS